MKMTIGKKLGLGFGTVVLFLVVSGLLAIQRLAGMNDRLNSIVDVTAEKVKLGARINQDLLAISRAEKNLILAQTQEKMDEYAAFIKKEREEMQARREKLRELVDESGKTRLEQFAAKWDEWLAVDEQVRGFSRLNSNRKAEVLSQGAAREASEKAELAMTRLVDKYDRDTGKATSIEVAREAAEKVRLAARINKSLIEIGRAEKNIIFADTKELMDEYVEATKAFKANISERLEKLDELVDDEGKTLVREFETALDNYYKLNDEVRNLISEQGNKKAFDLSSGKGRELADEAEALMAAIVDKNDEDMVEDKKFSDRSYALTRNLLLGMLTQPRLYLHSRVTSITLAALFMVSEKHVSLLTESHEPPLTGVLRS